MPIYTVQDTQTKKNITFEWNGSEAPTDTDMEEVFASVNTAPEPEQTLLQKAAPYVRPVLEAGGMAVGSILGTGAGPAGTIAGGAGGYVIGKEGANLYDEAVGLRKPENLMTERGALKKTAEVGQDLIAGAAMEAGGAVLGKGIEYAATKLPARLYGSAIKAPITKRWTEVLPSKEVSKRTSAIEAGLENKIYPTERGIAKVAQLEKQARNAVDDIIDVGAARGDSVVTDEILERGLKKAYLRASKSSDPEGAKKLVDEIAEKFKAHGETINAKDLNDIKRQLYDEVKWGGSEATALASQLNTMGKKGIAHEAMVALEGFYPEIKALNKQDASYIALKEAVERATARMGNNDIIGLSTKVIGIKSLPGAIVEWTVGHPNVKSTLAFALRKSGGNISKTVIPKAISYAVGSQINEQN